MPSKVKGKLFHLAPPQPKQRHIYWASLDFRGNIFLFGVCYFDPFIECPEKLLLQV